MKELIFHWVRVGELFPHARPLNFESKFEASLARRAISENDINFPIICESSITTRIDIFDSLWIKAGAKIYRYFYENDTYHDKNANDDSAKKKRCWLSTETTIKALTEIIAFLISEDKPVNLGSRSKNFRNKSRKDETQIALEKLLNKLKRMRKVVQGDSKLKKDLINMVNCTEDLKKFLPSFEAELEYFKQNFEAIELDKAIEMLEGSDNQKMESSPNEPKTTGLLEKIYSLTNRNNTLQENALIAVDLDLRLYFSDKKLFKEIDEQVLSINEPMETSNNKIEISILIKAIFDDLAESCSGVIKIKEYSKLRKAIAEYRDKFSFYEFDSDGFSPRKR